MLEEVFRSYHTGEIEANQAKMSDAIVALAKIIDRVLDTYNTNEGGVVKKMRFGMVIELLLFYQLFTKRIRCNILTISML